MSDTLKPWLADAAVKYRKSHGRNLSFPKKGRLVQVIQFNNYRRANVPEDKEKDVYAWAHDKTVEVLIKFDAEAINAFEESHSSFTSYRFGLFHLLEYKIVLGTDYIADEPRAPSRVPRTSDALPKPRIFFLHVTSFKYISSKGESNFATSTRSFEEITRDWKIDYEADEARKKGLVIKHKGGQGNAGPPRLEDMQAVADSLLAKKPASQSSTSSGRSPKRQKLSRSLNLNSLPSMDIDLLKKLSAIPTPISISPAKQILASALIPGLPPQPEPVPDGADAEPAQAPEDILPSTPPPPPTSSASTYTISDPPLPVRASEGSHVGQTEAVDSDSTPTKPVQTSTSVQSLNEDQDHPGAPELQVTEETPQAKDNPVPIDDDQTELSADKTNQSIPSSPPPADEVPMDTQSHSRKGKKKAEKLPRFPIDSQESNVNGEAEVVVDADGSDHACIPKDASTRKEDAVMQIDAKEVVPDEAESTDMPVSAGPSPLVQVGFLKDVQSSPQKEIDVAPSKGVHEQISLPAASFYARRKPLFRRDSEELNAEVDVGGQTTLSSKSPPATAANARELSLLAEEEDDKTSESGLSDASADGFEFVSFAEGKNEAAPSLLIKEEDQSLERALRSLPDNPFVPSQIEDTFFETAMDIDEPIELETLKHGSELPEWKLELRNISQNELDGLLSQVKSFTHGSSPFNTQQNIHGPNSRSASTSSSLYGQSALNGQLSSSFRSFFSTQPAMQPQQASQVDRKGKRRMQEDDHSVGAGSSRINTKARSSSTSSSIAFLGEKPNLGGLGIARHSSGAPATSIPQRRFASHGSFNSSQSPEVSRRILSASLGPKQRASSSLSQLGASQRRASGSLPIQRTGTEARKASNAMMAEMKERLGSKGLTTRQSLDLWYCCSGNFDIACEIADQNLATVQSMQDPPSTAEEKSHKRRKAATDKDLYRYCWTLEDDNIVEDPHPEKFVVARQLQEIEARRGRGSVKARKQFLRENPIARQLSRKVRYPYDEDEDG